MNKLARVLLGAVALSWRPGELGEEVTRGLWLKLEVAPEYGVPSSLIRAMS